MNGPLLLQGDDASLLPGWLQVLAACLLLVVLVAAYVATRRRGGGRAPFAAWLRLPPAGGLVQSQRPLRLTPASSLHVVRWEGEELLLACGGGGVQLLARRSAPASAVQGEPS